MQYVSLYKKWWKTMLPAMAVLFFLSCQKNLTGPSVDTGTLPDFTTKVTARNVSGFVTNENNQPVQGASVKIGSSIVTTDEYGFFQTTNVLMVKSAATVTVTQTGYFKGIKTFMAEEGKNAFFRIKLIPKTVAGTVDASTGGNVSTGSGVKITFPAGAVVNAATNAAYTGSINVAASWIDPTSRELSSIMPGDLRGIDENNYMKKLTTYGMVAVELTGAGGELLQIASGKKATVDFPVPTSIAGSAPATIALWSFDENNGLWKQEGTATKNGNTYTGDVSHFSFWNCDVPANYVQVNMTLQNGDGVPFRYTLVRISVLSNPQNQAWGYTDSSGYVAGAVPANEQLKLEVFLSAYCGTSVYSQNFTTGSSNLSLGTITVTAPALMAAYIQGTATDCNNQPVTNGFVIMNTSSGFYRSPINNGNFTAAHYLCNGPETVTFVAEDITNSQQSPSPFTYILNSGDNSIPNLQACGVTTEQFFNITINGTPTNYTFPADSLGHYQSWNGTNTPDNNVTTMRSNPFSSTNLIFKNSAIAVGSSQQLLNLYTSLVSDTLRPAGTINVNISEYGSVSQFMSGSFSGTFTGNPPANTPYTVSASFRVRRSF